MLKAALHFPSTLCSSGQPHTYAQARWGQSPVQCLVSALLAVPCPPSPPARQKVNTVSPHPEPSQPARQHKERRETSWNSARALDITKGCRTSSGFHIREGESHVSWPLILGCLQQRASSTSALYQCAIKVRAAMTLATTGFL